VSHDECWDEWWVFDSTVPEDFKVTAFCNFCLPIAEYKQLDFENGCQLDLFLERYRPAAVFGNHQFSAYIVYAETEGAAT
jgi:hypothetical protein